MAYEITISELRRAVPAISQANAVKYAEWLSATCERFEINTPLRIAHFLAQLGHESWDFARTVENLNYSAKRLREVFGKYFPTEALAKQYANKPTAIGNRVYANRMGNGSESSGDGFRFRGRGLLQHTGRNNYDALGDWLGFDFVGNPDALFEPKWACLAAGAYWQHNNLNYWADRDDIVTITKRINGGTNGLSDRRARLEKAKLALRDYHASRPR